MAIGEKQCCFCFNAGVGGGGLLYWQQLTYAESPGSQMSTGFQIKQHWDQLVPEWESACEQ